MTEGDRRESELPGWWAPKAPPEPTGYVPPSPGTMSPPLAPPQSGCVPPTPDLGPPLDPAPDWAIKRATEIYNKQYPFVFPDGRLLEVFARYITEHEEPPVDPDLLAARKWCADFWTDDHPCAERYSQGEKDDGPMITSLALPKGKRKSVLTPIKSTS